MTLTRIVVIVVALAAAIVGVYAVFRAFDDRSAPPIIIEDAAAIWPVVVDVRGAVASPGVYELPPGARVQDAVAAAGGFAEDADLATLNLARRLRDGEVVFIAALPGTGTPAAAMEPDVTGGDDARININTATAAELEALPGIGEVIAQRIVDYREEHGPFRSVDELIHVEGISAGMIEELRNLVTTGP